MKHVFFEVQPWEEALLKSTFPDAVLTPDKLESSNASSYADAEVISPFIYSNVSQEVINVLPQLKYIATRSTGFDHIDTAYCKTKGITVSNVPEYGSATVAEHTFALMLSLTRKIYQSVNQAKHLSFEHTEIQGVDINGKTLGVIGLGKIGINVVKIAKGFGMNVVVYNHSQEPELASQYGFSYVDLPSLLAGSDIVTLHLPLNDQTHHIINKENIKQMKKGSYLLNTARGGLVETEAIVCALDDGILEGVGLDVLEEEKELCEEAELLTTSSDAKVNIKNLLLDHVLMNHPKVLITPHNAFNSKEALLRILHTTIDNISHFEKGELINTV